MEEKGYISRAIPPIVRSWAKKAETAESENARNGWVTKMRDWARKRYEVNVPDNLTLDQTMALIATEAQKVQTAKAEEKLAAEKALAAKASQPPADGQQATEDGQEPGPAPEPASETPVGTSGPAQPWPGAESDPGATGDALPQDNTGIGPQDNTSIPFAAAPPPQVPAPALQYIPPAVEAAQPVTQQQPPAPAPIPETPPVQAQAKPESIPLAPGLRAEAEHPAPKPAPRVQPVDPAKPVHPLLAAGYRVGGEPRKGQFYDAEGNPLLPDSAPVLTEAEARAQENNGDYRDEGEPDPFTQGAFGAPGRQPSERFRHGPARGPRHFRHQQHTTFLVNPRTGMAYTPTEILMRRADLTPVYGHLPDGVYWGG